MAQPTPDASDAVAFGAAHPRSGSTGPAGEGPPPPPAPQGSDLDALRHPYESTRFALALSGAVLVFGVTIILLLRGGGPGALIGVAAALLLLLATVWWFLQIGRSRLLGRAAEVTPATFPELDAAIRTVRAELGYNRAVTVFVVGSADPPVELSSYLGTRILLLDGDLVAELSEPENRDQLRFLLATSFGALKAAHDVWTPAFLAVSALDRLKLLNFFLAPWQRATVYTGDQIAMHTVGRLDESLVALNRMLVGKRLAREVGMTGVLDQAASVRRRWLPRVQQLYAGVPHLTNRYLNLIAFAERSTPEQVRTYERQLDPDTVQRVHEGVARSVHRRGQRPSSSVPVIASLGGTIAVLALLAIVLPPDVGLDLTDVLGPEPAVEETPPEPTPEPPMQPTGGIVEGASSPGLPIPDADPAGVEDVLVATGEGTVEEVRVGLVVSHDYPQDLVVTLISPSGTPVELFSRTPEPPVWFDVSNVPALMDLVGEPVAGDWTLWVRDDVADDEGVLDAWELTVLTR